jgi:hypothetical protein
MELGEDQASRQPHRQPSSTSVVDPEAWEAASLPPVVQICRSWSGGRRRWIRGIERSSVSFPTSRHHTCIKQAGQRHDAIIRSVILGSNVCVHASRLRDHEVLIHKILHHPLLLIPKVSRRAARRTAGRAAGAAWRGARGPRPWRRRHCRHQHRGRTSCCC